MKKIILSVVVAIVAVLGFSGCHSYGVAVAPAPAYPSRAYYVVYPSVPYYYSPYRTYNYYPYRGSYYRPAPPPPPPRRHKPNKPHHRR